MYLCSVHFKMISQKKLKTKIPEKLNPLFAVIIITQWGCRLSDCFLSSYPSARKRLKKYCQKQFRYILDLAVQNVHMLYKKSGGIISRLNFILKLVDRVIETYSQEKIQFQKGRRSFPDTLLRLTARYIPENILSKPSKKRPARRCHVCAAKGIRKETIYYCCKCNTSLCIVPCLKIYHTILKFGYFCIFFFPVYLNLYIACNFSFRTLSFFKLKLLCRIFILRFVSFNKSDFLKSAVIKNTQKVHSTSATFPQSSKQRL